MAAGVSRHSLFRGRELSEGNLAGSCGGNESFGDVAAVGVRVSTRDGEEGKGVCAGVFRLGVLCAGKFFGFGLYCRASGLGISTLERLSNSPFEVSESMKRVKRS